MKNPLLVSEDKSPSSKRYDSLNAALASQDFSVQLRGDIPELKVSSEYYAQVMGPVFCCGFKSTHLVVYAEKWIVVFKVVFFESTWIAMKSKLDGFYFNHAVPYMASLQESSQDAPVTQPLEQCENVASAVLMPGAKSLLKVGFCISEKHDMARV